MSWPTWGLLMLVLALVPPPTASAQSTADPFADEANVSKDTGRDPFATYEQDHTATNKTNATNQKANASVGAPQTSGTTDSAPTAATPTQPASTPEKKAPGAGTALTALAIVGAVLLAATWRRR